MTHIAKSTKYIRIQGFRLLKSRVSYVDREGTGGALAGGSKGSVLSTDRVVLVK